MQRHFENSEVLCKYVSENITDTVLCAFSAGTDSIACYYQLKKYFAEVVPFYMYVVPDLEFIERTLNYFENKFDNKIIRVPHPMIIQALNNNMFNYQHNVKSKFYNEYYNETIHNLICEQLGIPLQLCGIGNKMTDTPYRYFALKKHGSVNYKRSLFYPIYDWHEADVRNCIKENNVKIPIDYKIFGRSYDGLVYRFSAPLKKHFPNDYEKIKEFFPLIDVELIRSNL